MNSIPTKQTPKHTERTKPAEAEEKIFRPAQARIDALEAKRNELDSAAADRRYRFAEEQCILEHAGEPNVFKSEFNGKKPSKEEIRSDFRGQRSLIHREVIRLSGEAAPTCNAILTREIERILAASDAVEAEDNARCEKWGVPAHSHIAICLRGRIPHLRARIASSGTPRSKLAGIVDLDA